MTNAKLEEPLLLKILPEQVSDNWEQFAPLIEKSLPPTVLQRRQRMANVLRAVLMEDLVVWVYYDQNQNERYVASTVIRTDKVSLSKSLLIYSFTSLGQLQPKQLWSGIEKLKKYAEGNDCNNLIAYTADENVKEFLSETGVDIQFSLAQIRI